MKIGKYTLDRIYVGDCVEMIGGIPDGSIHLTVTSPPYDAMRKYEAGSKWTMDDIEYMAHELYRVTIDGGVCCWVTGDQTINGSETGTSFRTALQFMSAGWNLHDTMIWRKKALPQRAVNRRYAGAFEYIFVFSKGRPRVWEPVLKHNKYAGTTQHGKHRMDGRTLKKFNGHGKPVKTFGIVDNVFEIDNGGNGTSHPAVYPVELAQRLIMSWSNLGDIVFDPFAGSGTTCMVAQSFHCHYLGFDISRQYIKEARQRIREYKKPLD